MKHLFFLTLCLITASTYSQDNPQSLFWNNYSITNPAATGLFSKHYASITARDQWIKFDYNPITINSIYDFQISKNQSIGTNYQFDKIGFFKTNTLNLNYAYRFQFSEKTIVSLGTSVNYKQLRLDPIWTTPDGTSLVNNPSIPAYYNREYFDVNVGAMVKTDKILFGISYINGFNKFNSHKIFTTFSYLMSINENFKLKPNFQLRLATDIPYFIADVNVTATIKKIFDFGLSYRSNNWIGVNAGFNFKEKFSICYAFDYIPEYPPLGTTHELGLVMKLN